MATLQKFKLLATQCGVAQSPTRSPRTSPMVQLRRRKTTLRMLLSRRTGRRSPRRRDPRLQLKNMFGSLEGEKKKKKKEKRKDLMQRQSLKELFVSSPKEETSEEIPRRELDSMGTVVALGGSVFWSNGPGSPKLVWRGFRFRSLLKKAWRPGLDTIPE